MKKMKSLLAISICLVLFVSVFAVISTAKSYAKQEAITDEVVFVSDDNSSGDGSGSDASNPLRPVISDALNKPNSDVALYQAAAKLKDNGGTIVICGKVELNDTFVKTPRDFTLPSSTRQITITSLYNGVDYASTNGASLSMTGNSSLILGSPVTFENITIETHSVERVICANGNRLVMGEGINCVGYNGDGASSLSATTANKRYFVSVAGGHRYYTTKADTDVVVKSGTYNIVCGSIWSINQIAANPYYDFIHNGDANLTIEGGTVLGYVTGTGVISYKSTRISGDVNIIIKGGTYYGSIYGCTDNSFTTENSSVFISIGKNADISNLTNLKAIQSNSGSTTRTLHTMSGGVSTGTYEVNIYEPQSAVLDMASAQGLTSVLKAKFDSAYTTFDTVYPPSPIVTAVRNVVTPTESCIQKGGTPTLKGTSATIDYNSGTYSGSLDIDYSDIPSLFNVSCDSSTPGNVKVGYLYGTKVLEYKYVTVTNSPSAFMMGVKIKTNDTNQKMRYYGHYEKVAGVTVTDYGFLAMPSYMLKNDADLNFEQTYGMYEYHFTASDVTSLYENENGVTYYADGNILHPNQFTQNYTIVSFVTFTANGQTFTVYSNAIQRNPAAVAKLIVDNAKESTAVKTAVDTNVLQALENYSVDTQYQTTSTITALRNKAVAYMKKQANIEWTPKESFWVYNDGTTGVGINTFYQAGKTYYGIPYTNTYYTQYESFVDLLNADKQYTGTGATAFGGTPTLSSTGSVTSSTTSAQKETAYENYKTFPGSDCSTAVLSAWSVLMNNTPTSASVDSTYSMIPWYGKVILPVGDYLDAVDFDDTLYITGEYVTRLYEAGDMQELYESYALLQPGDAIIARWNDTTKVSSTLKDYKYSSDGITKYTAGHTRMVTGNTVVVRNSDGTIDPEKSYIITTEEANSLYKNATQTWANSTWRVDVQYTFKSLANLAAIDNAVNHEGGTLEGEYMYCSSHYLPVTIREFTTGNADNEFTCLTDFDMSEISKGTINGIIQSNKRVIGYRITIKDTANNEVFSETYFDKAVRNRVADLDLSDVEVTGLSAGTEYVLDIKGVIPSTSDGNISFISDYHFTY